MSKDWYFKCDVEEVDYLFVNLYGDAQTVIIKDATYFFPDVLCFSRCGVSDGKSVVSVKSYVCIKVFELGE